MFPGLDMCYTDLARHLITVGEDLDDLLVDDLSVAHLSVDGLSVDDLSDVWKVWSLASLVLERVKWSVGANRYLA